MGRASAAQQPTIQPERSVTQVSRIAVRIGEDFYTLESVVTLAPGASDEEISTAIDTGTRIYLAQRSAMDTQVAELRTRMPSALPVPPTKKQLDEVGRLQGLV